MTLIEAQEFYNAAKTAYLAACNAEDYSFGSQRKKMAAIDKYRAEMEYWDDKVASLSGTTKPRKAFRITPRDL